MVQVAAGSNQKDVDLKKRYSSALHELADPENLRIHLDFFYRDTAKSKRTTTGPDGLSLNRIGRKNLAFIRQLSTELLTKSVRSPLDVPYTHQPLAIFPLLKPDGKSYRAICIPTVRDRLVQRAMLKLLEDRGLKFGTPISYGDRQNRSVKRAVNNALKYRNVHPFVFKTDITKFFDRIDRNKIKSLVQKRIRLPSLHRLVFQAIDAEIATSYKRRYAAEIALCGIKAGVGLRQGLPLSPLLSSLYLEPFDYAAHNKGFRVIRYADDLAFFCDSQEECHRAHQFCVGALKSLGLDVPDLGKHSKSRIYKPNERVEFLGLEMALQSDSKYHLRISDSQISKTHNKFEEYCDIHRNVEQGWKFSNLISKLEALAHSYKGHYGEAENYEQFERNLVEWKHLVYRKIVTDGLGVQPEDLDSKTKVFFHLTENKLV